VIHRRLAVAFAAGLLVVAACSGGTAAPPSFDPSAPCAGADEQVMAGAYPNLETVLPAALAGVVPTNRESGRYCSRTTLGALVDKGIVEAHFGAVTWDRGGGKAISLVLFEANGLTADALFESYQNAAAANSKIHDLRASTLTINGLAARRIDFLNGDSSFQAVIVWSGDGPGRVRVALSADLTTDEVQAALDAFH
jgi:hypothetical protein